MDLAKFFDGVRGRPFGGKLRQGQVDGCNTLIAAFERAGWPVEHATYGLATAFHETAATMQPIAEDGRGKGRKYGVKGRHGQVAYGRGYVQLTWDYNYEKADDELGLGGALTADYDLALRPDIAADIMVRGMQEGWFTGKANRTYLDKSPPDYVNARRIINGTDKASLIAGYAREFEAALRAAAYGEIVATEPAKPVPAGGVIYPPAVVSHDKPNGETQTALPIADEKQPARSHGKHEAPASELSFWHRIKTLFGL